MNSPLVNGQVLAWSANNAFPVYALLPYVEEYDKDGCLSDTSQQQLNKINTFTEKAIEEGHDVGVLCEGLGHVVIAYSKGYHSNPYGDARAFKADKIEVQWGPEIWTSWCSLSRVWYFRNTLVMRPIVSQGTCPSKDSDLQVGNRHFSVDDSKGYDLHTAITMYKWLKERAVTKCLTM